MGCHGCQSLSRQKGGARRDDPADGFTDSPPFMATDDFTFKPAIPGEVMVPVVQLYTVAFWKKFLEGDRHYMRYLTPGYARTNGLAAVVEIRD